MTGAAGSSVAVSAAFLFPFLQETIEKTIAAQAANIKVFFIILLI